MRFPWMTERTDRPARVHFFVYGHYEGIPYTQPWATNMQNIYFKYAWAEGAQETTDFREAYMAGVSGDLEAVERYIGGFELSC